MTTVHNLQSSSIDEEEEITIRMSQLAKRQAELEELRRRSLTKEQGKDQQQSVIANRSGQIHESSSILLHTQCLPSQLID
jgi:hypothetical protein